MRLQFILLVSAAATAAATSLVPRQKWSCDVKKRWDPYSSHSMAIDIGVRQWEVIDNYADALYSRCFETLTICSEYLGNLLDTGCSIVFKRRSN
ncbi:hypothetical protein LA080_015309 [Diaporthe eres]|nr:hypothetical protein LA080_015309 [Diaporthe eres]